MLVHTLGQVLLHELLALLHLGLETVRGHLGQHPVLGLEDHVGHLDQYVLTFLLWSLEFSLFGQVSPGC